VLRTAARREVEPCLGGLLARQLQPQGRLVGQLLGVLQRLPSTVTCRLPAVASDELAASARLLSRRFIVRRSQA